MDKILTVAKKVELPLSGQVTYRFADGSTVTNDVDDVSNPPRVVHDEDGPAEVVED